MTGKRKNDRAAEAMISLRIVGPVPKRGRVVRKEDALYFLARAMAAKEPKAKQAATVMAKFVLFSGLHNEAHGYHARRPKGSTRYAEADAAAREWIAAESARTSEKRANTLVRRYLDAHPDHPGASRESTHKRLVRQWTKSQPT